MPVVATVEHHALARAIDAGLLLDRIERLPQFRDLRSFAEQTFALPDPRSAA